MRRFRNDSPQANNHQELENGFYISKEENGVRMSLESRLRLILVRHGESVANVTRLLQGQSGGELTEHGLRQADWLGNHLRRFQIDHIISSDLRRVRQTVAQVNKHLNLPITESAEVREWNVGILDGQPQSVLPTAVQQSGKSLFEFAPQNGERLMDVFHRASNFINKLTVQENNGKTVLLASHGDFLRMTLANLQSIPLTEANQIHLKNTSFTVADLDPRGAWNVHVLNSTAHFVTVDESG